MRGPSNVQRRRDDALSRIERQALERLLAAYYRELGWWVEHSGTGAVTGAGASRFDGDVDLRLRRDADVVLVQCKHWNAKQVTHDAVHELLGLMVDERATAAILFSGGEFTKAAIAAAGRSGLVTLIDGDALRGMLGALPETPDPVDPFVEASAIVHSTSAHSTSAHPTSAHPTSAHPTSAHPTSPAQARQGGRNPGGRRHDWRLWLIALLCAIGFVLLIRAILDRTADTAGEPPPRPPTEAEIRESQRKADEAMRAIEETTPGM